MNGNTPHVSASREYRIWSGMLARCLNPNRKDFPSYGGRGITVCKRWRSFENFLADMGKCPAGGTLDRINNNGNYEPSNVRWATRAVQMRNTRRNRLLTIDGETMCMADWAIRGGIPLRTIRSRFLRLGWNAKDAVFTPSYGRKISC